MAKKAGASRVTKKVKRAKVAKKVKTAKKAKTKKTKKAKKKQTAKKAASPGILAKATGFIPPYKCQRTLDKGVCLRFRYNPTNQQWDLGGEQVSCSDCQYFM
jgi:hypothetical protein